MCMHIILSLALFFVLVLSLQHLHLNIMSKSNYAKVHPEKDPGPYSAPKCCKFDPSNRYVHLCQKALDQSEFTHYVDRQCKITDTDCICRRCESEFKRSFFKFKAGEPDEASKAKRACTDNEDNKCFIQFQPLLKPIYS